MKKNSKKNKAVSGIATIVAAAVFIYITAQGYLNEQSPLQSSEGVSVALAKCVDGDTATLTIDGKEEKVRFLAIDTPETVKPNTPVQKFGKEASTFTCDALTNATQIKLEYEKEMRDKYNRLLAWIWVDGKLLQQELIQKGYAEVKYEKKYFKYVDQLYGVQENATKERVGIWSE